VNRRRRQRSQAMTEFALVAPVLLLLTFGIIDFGRALYFYTVADGAAREAMRTATASSNPLATDAAVKTAAAVRFPGGTVTTSNGCYNGPIPSTAPPDNVAWIFITELNPTIGAAVQSNPPFTTANAPGGEPSAAATGSCSAVNPASGSQQLQVTVEYNYVPVTPLISQLVSGHLVFRLQVTGRTEY
jgi:Flp pilus assembly protein TadG